MYRIKFIANVKVESSRAKVRMLLVIPQAELEEVEVVRRSYHNAKAKSNRRAQVLEEEPRSPTSPSPPSSEEEQSGEEDDAGEAKDEKKERESQIEESPGPSLDKDAPEDEGVSEASAQVEKLALEEAEPESVTERL